MKYLMILPLLLLMSSIALSSDYIEIVLPDGTIMYCDKYDDGLDFY
jgi:hypothetical protein